MGSEERARIVSHRGAGFGYKPGTLQALVKAWQLGFSVELDLRVGPEGELLIAHDSEDKLLDHKFEELIGQALKDSISEHQIVAVNVKEDGVGKFFRAPDTSNFYFFDASVPELLKIKSQGYKTLRRWSEYEPPNIQTLEKLTDGVWCDQFNSSWMMSDPGFTETEGVRVFVSPELHGRAHMEFWKWFKSRYAESKFDFICTDFPLALEDYLD